MLCMQSLVALTVKNNPHYGREIRISFIPEHIIYIKGASFLWEGVNDFRSKNIN